MENTYIPSKIRLEYLEYESDDTSTFFFDRNLDSRPGQFVELSIPGYGEAPISINSTADEKLRLTVRAVGNLTKAMHRMNVGDTAGIRGPFGRGWPMDDIKKEDVLIVAGGIGLAPLRAVIVDILTHREQYGRVELLYGARSPELILHKKELGEWMEKMDVRVTVDECTEYRKDICRAWKGDVGVVTTLFEKSSISEDGTAFICGPPIMMKFAVKGLLERGFAPERIYVSLERQMKCGMGMCGHCQIGGHYVCKDGPVFSVAEFMEWAEKPEEMEGVL